MRIYGSEKISVILGELGERIKDIRIGRNMTQNELADNAGVSFSTVVRIEKGESVNIENFMKVMRVFGLLENFGFLVPEQVLSPEDIYKNRRKKNRANKSRKAEDVEWTWEDEKT